MKDLVEADIILRMKLIRSPEGIALSLAHFIKKMIEKFGYLDQKHVSAPYDPSFHLKNNLGELVDQMRYSQIIDLSYI